MMTAHIVGKGITARYLSHDDYKNDIFVAINHAAIFMDRIDYLFANDVEGLEGIPDEVFERVKTLAIPHHPHLNGKPREDITHEYVLEKYKKFPMNHLIYNLGSWEPKNPKYITPYACQTTAGRAIGYLLGYQKVKKICLYGIANGEGYHPDIMEVLPPPQHKFQDNWKKQRTEDLRDSIKRATRKFKATLEIN